MTVCKIKLNLYFQSKHLKPLQAARPVVKNVPARTKSKAGVGQGESVQNSTVSTTTSVS